MARSESLNSNYFSDALNLFVETQWLYNTPVTDFLSKRLLDLFPKELLDDLRMLENEELNDLVANRITQPNFSETLKVFVERCKEIDRLPIINTVLPVTLPKSFRIGLSCKKQHEIMRLADLVHAQCTSENIRVVVDLGAGLGYVCQLLYHLHGYRVLGLERSEENVRNARNRQAKMYPDSLAHVKYSCCDLTCGSVETIERILSNEFEETSNVCLIGLHACGDLSVHAWRIFRDMKAARVFIVMPCCYHKLSLLQSVEVNASTEKQYFKHFPLSNRLKTAINDAGLDIGPFLRQPFLRLACQEPANRWNNMTTENHDKHSFHVLARAVLQLYATESE